MGRRILIKVGGSLISPSVSEELSELSEVIRELSLDHSVVLLTGGGGPVEFLRSLDRSLGMDDRNAHFAALAGMEMNAYVLQSLLPEASGIDEIVEDVRDHSPLLFFPLEFFKKKDPLYHSWDVTSDSIALYLADQFRCDLLILLKSVDGIMQPAEAAGISEKARRGQTKGLIGGKKSGRKGRTERIVPRFALDDSEGSGVVDGYFYRYPRDRIRGFLECRILNGRYPERLGELLKRGDTIGTELVF